MSNHNGEISINRYINLKEWYGTEKNVNKTK